jgi:hypothetical protein
MKRNRITLEVPVRVLVEYERLAKAAGVPMHTLLVGQLNLGARAVHDDRLRVRDDDSRASWLRWAFAA